MVAAGLHLVVCMGTNSLGRVLVLQYVPYPTSEIIRCVPLLNIDEDKKQNATL